MCYQINLARLQSWFIRSDESTNRKVQKGLLVPSLFSRFLWLHSFWSVLVEKGYNYYYYYQRYSGCLTLSLFSVCSGPYHSVSWSLCCHLVFFCPFPKGDSTAACNSGKEQNPKPLHLPIPREVLSTFHFAA